MGPFILSSYQLHAYQILVVFVDLSVFLFILIILIRLKHWAIFDYCFSIAHIFYLIYLVICVRWMLGWAHSKQGPVENLPRSQRPSCRSPPYRLRYPTRLPMYTQPTFPAGEVGGEAVSLDNLWNLPGPTIWNVTWWHGSRAEKYI